MAAHKHALLLRAAALDSSTLFECPEIEGCYYIAVVTSMPEYSWKIYNKPKPKIKRWLWASKQGHITSNMYSEEEQKERSSLSPFTIKLLWSETEFEE